MFMFNDVLYVLGRCPVSRCESSPEICKMGGFEKKRVTQMLQQSILQLCRASLSGDGEFEVDGIICISKADDDQIVIKMHELINSSQDGRDLHALTHPVISASDKLAELSASAGQKKRKKPMPIYEIIDDPSIEMRQLNKKHHLKPEHNIMKEHNMMQEHNMMPENELNDVMLGGNLVEVDEIDESPSVESLLTGVVKKPRIGLSPSVLTPGGKDKHDRGDYNCAYCNRLFNSRVSLSLHVSKKHGAYSMVYCGGCKTGFVDRRTLNTHVCIGMNDINEKNLRDETASPGLEGDAKASENSNGSSNRLRQILLEGRNEHASKMPNNQNDLIVIGSESSASNTDEPGSSPGRGRAGSNSPVTVTNNTASPATVMECQICHDVYDAFDQLEEHCLSSHKRYPCSFCLNTFTERFSRDRHYRVHSGVKPYQCGSCNRGYTRRDHLRVHCENVHGTSLTAFDAEYKSGIYYPSGEGQALHDPPGDVVSDTTRRDPTSDIVSETVRQVVNSLPELLGQDVSGLLDDVGTDQVYSTSASPAPSDAILDAPTLPVFPVREIEQDAPTLPVFPAREIEQDAPTLPLFPDREVEQVEQTDTAECVDTEPCVDTEASEEQTTVDDHSMVEADAANGEI